MVSVSDHLRFDVGVLPDIVGRGAIKQQAVFLRLFR
jgi:hypothetical protein